MSSHELSRSPTISHDLPRSLHGVLTISRALRGLRCDYLFLEHESLLIFVAHLDVETIREAVKG